MAAKPHVIAALALSAVAAASFLIGRKVDLTAAAARTARTALPAPRSSAITKPEPACYRDLQAIDVTALSFAEFYEALRSAPNEARKKWAVELQQMPPGPRRTAAVTGFYKLLIQFDPVLAIKTIREIQDKGIQNIALAGAASAAPGFAMEALAGAMAELYEEPTGHTRSYFSELMEQWIDLDPAAVIRFGEQHPGIHVPYLASTELISNWAELDPKAAKEWLDRHDQWKTPEYRRAFISGWYESDRPAAVSYVLAHASEPEMRESVGNTLRGLYYDAKDEARKFVEALPDDRIRHAAFRAAFENMLYDEIGDGGEPAFSPRAVAEWMVEFPPAYWKGRLKDVFKWSGKPPQEMISWVEQQSPAIRDAVAAEYTPPRETPAADALGAVLQVADPRLREQLLEALFKRSYDAPAEDMREAVSKAPLSAEQRAHVLQLMADVESRPIEDAADETTNDYGSEK
jgi:hypothetical protein